VRHFGTGFFVYFRSSFSVSIKGGNVYLYGVLKLLVHN